MKYLLIKSLFIVLLLQNNINISELKKDPIFIQYKIIFNELKDASNNRKYKIPRDINLSKELSKNGTKEGMIKILKEKGMLNSEEFVNKLFLQTTLMFEFLKKHPEISTLDYKAKTELITKLLID